jgi:hypothetical protein
MVEIVFKTKIEKSCLIVKTKIAQLAKFDVELETSTC